MRILALTNLYPSPPMPHRAPFNRHQFRILGERHPVRVIAPVAWTEELSARRRGAVGIPSGRQTQFDGLTVEHPRYLFPPKVARGWYGHCFAASVKRAFRRAVAEFRPDLVFAPWAYPDGWAAVRLGRAAKLPVVLQCHGSDVLLADRFPARKRRTVEAVTAADGVVAVSHDIAGRLFQMTVPLANVRVIHDGVDRSVFRPGDQAEARRAIGLPADERLLLFVGNLLPVKGVDILLTACRDLLAAGEPFHLRLVGQGPSRSALERQVALLGLTKHVTFVGPIPHAALPNWFRSADVFVLPSRSEGVPNVLLEASASGVPWVASHVGGIPEIAGLGRSRLVPPERHIELAEAIRLQLHTPTPTPVTGPRDRSAAVDDLEAFFRSVLDRRTKVSPA